MREIEASGSTARDRTPMWLRALRLGAITLGICLVVTPGVARAEDEDDDKTFEERIIEGLMAGLGGTNMENRGIEYRERSPLVVPPRLDLPPPVSASQVPAANWPKDPDVARRKAAIAARKNNNKDPAEAARVLMSSELAQRGTKTSTASSESLTPGGEIGPNSLLSPSQLGYSGGFGKLFGGGNRVEVAPFKGEPTRDSLTQPPSGYQTPSPNFAYGTGPKQSLVAKPYNPAAGQYGD